MPKKSKGGFAENVRFLVTLLVLAVLLRSLIVAPFNIPSESMLPRLLVGDYLFVAKWPYGYSRYSFPFGLVPINGRILGSGPERGDVV
ncbi:MAG: S26 family signal peptidase, partial [Sphingomonadaceae bacterium]